MPKVGIFTRGAKSIIVAADSLLAITGCPSGNAIRVAGATPIEQDKTAPVTSCVAIRFSLSSVAKVTDGLLYKHRVL